MTTLWYLFIVDLLRRKSGKSLRWLVHLQYEILPLTPTVLKLTSNNKTSLVCNVNRTIFISYLIFVCQAVEIFKI